MCGSVPAACRKSCVTVQTYCINSDFLPLWNFEMKEGEWLYLCDFYGQLTDECVEMALSRSGGRLIIDEVQSFFAKPRHGIDTLYTCRKYFGVPDGAFLYSASKLSRELPKDVSMGRMEYVLGRFEVGSQEYFQQAQRNNAVLEECGLCSMSALTENLLRGIDYDAVIEARNKNYGRLESALSAKNLLSLLSVNGPFAYPFLVDDGPSARKVLAKRGVFIATLWPNVLEETDEHSVAYVYAKNILPLPIDQRYGIDDMDYILNALEEEKII